MAAASQCSRGARRPACVPGDTRPPARRDPRRSGRTRCDAVGCGRGWRLRSRAGRWSSGLRPRTRRGGAPQKAQLDYWAGRTTGHLRSTIRTGKDCRSHQRYEATLFQDAWVWFQGPAGPIANLLQISGAIISVAIFMWGAAYSWFRHRLRHSGALIARLQEDLSYRTEQLDRSKAREKQLETACTEVTRRLAETAGAEIAREVGQRNYKKAHDMAREWLALEGEPITTILRFEAEWAILHATGNAHVAGFVVAEAFASAARTIWPHDTNAAKVADELKRFCDAERIGASPAFRDALEVLEDVDTNRLFDARSVDWALALEQQALHLESRGSFRAALVQIEAALEVLRRELGAEASAPLRIRSTRVRLLLWVGNASSALVEIEDVVAVFSRALGPQHPNTWAGRLLFAQVLQHLGRLADALPIIEDVVKKQTLSPEFGPQHPNTLAAQHLLAQVLQHLGRLADAGLRLVAVRSAASTRPMSPPAQAGAYSPDLPRSRAPRHLSLVRCGRAPAGASCYRHRMSAGRYRGWRTP